MHGDILFFFFVELIELSLLFISILSVYTFVQGLPRDNHAHVTKLCL